MYLERIERIRKEKPFMSMADIAYTLLLDDIIWMRFQPEDRLKENVLADAFRMSRTPVKDALKRLEEHGYIVKAESQSGYMLTPFDIVDYADFNEMRLAIEPIATYYASRYLSAEGRDELAQILRDYEVATKQCDIYAMHKLDDQFHRTIVRESQNPYFIQIYDQYENKCMYYRNITWFSGSNTYYHVKKHARIYKRIIEHDEAGARNEMQAHLSFYMKNGLQRMRKSRTQSE